MRFWFIESFSRLSSAEASVGGFISLFPNCVELPKFYFPFTRWLSPRGALIVFEGLDRAGKSTQTQLLAENLEKEGIPHKVIRFPDRTTPVGKLIDSYLKSETTVEDHVINLLFCANRWELAKSIRESLEAGVAVICDRYAYSGVAYSVATGLYSDWCRTPNDGLPKPDRVVYLDLDVYTAATRGNYGTERFENIDFQKKVEAEFYALVEGDSWSIMNATLLSDKLAKLILIQVKDTIDDVKDEPVYDLWG
jgi:dTMP kinase